MPIQTRNTLSQPLAKPPMNGSRGLARLHAVAAAVILCTGLMHTSGAQALGLGRVIVQSALGEPLRAEIEVPEISAEEAASLRVGLASGDAFRAAGMEFNAALVDLQVSLQRRADGRAFLRLSSARPVNEPFMDMILEASWANGRIVRDYTLLFDPPSLRQPAAAPLAPNVTAAPVPAVTAAAANPGRPVVPPAGGTPRVTAPAPVRAAAPAVPATASEATAPADARDAQKLRVRAGDTAGRIAAANKPANVSLDQMLVAMLRANPQAFIGGNVNRIKAGAVIDVPGEQQAQGVQEGEARQVIAAQSRDFNEFRRRVAQAVPQTGVAAADRQASGKVEAEVEDKKPTAPAQDKLTLTKPTSSAAAEAKIAQDRQSKEATDRVAELKRNIDELAKIAPPAATAPPPQTAPSVPAAPAAAPPATAAVDNTPSIPATAPASPAAPEAAPVASPNSPAAQAPAEQPAPSTPPKPKAAPKPAPVPETEAEPSFLAELTGNPLVLPAAGGLLALLAGFGFYRMRQRKKAAGVDSSFLESRLQPDSFFGSSGGQRIDTAEAPASGSSMVYSPSQLDAAGDVDPVAEADVYLAYGRDLQAEEILKEAMRGSPTRVAIHSKLLEIYAKRRDAKAFEVVAVEVFGLTQGQGTEWEHACELGRELDASNPLYQPGGQPPGRAGAVAAAGGAASTVPFGSSTLTQHTGPGNASPDSELSLDLDLDLDMSTPAPVPQLTPVVSSPAPLTDNPVSGMDDLQVTDELTRATQEARQGPASMPMDFDLDFPSDPMPLTPEVGSAAKLPNDDLSSLDFDEPQPLPSGRGASAQAPLAADDMLSFDLNDINLDLGEQAKAAEMSEATGGLTEENPLETKLSLAEEFRAIGDLEGARSLAEEVLAEASGSLKSKAASFLADLS